MKLSIMQPYFFPYIGYFQGINAVDKYILYENLDYIKDGWMHRNRILVKHREPTFITVNLQQKSINKKIYEMKLDSRINWKQDIIKSIFFNYKGSKYFEEFFPIVELIVLAQYDNLHDYNCNCIKSICDFLEINTQIQTNNTIYLELEELLENNEFKKYNFNPVLRKTCPTKKTARVLEICINENANIFINAIGGIDLYKKEEFDQYGVKLYFINSLPYEYKQFSNTFFSNLSIIDVLMHCGREKTIRLLDNYTLI